MARFILSFSCFFTVAYTQADKREEIDRYNEETLVFMKDDPDRCLARLDHAIAWAGSMDYAYAQGYASFVKGYVYRTQEELGKAFVANLAGLTFLLESGDERTPELLAKLYLNAGEIFKKRYKYDEALIYYNEGLVIAEREKLTDLAVSFNYNMGYANQVRGNLDQTLFYVYRAAEGTKIRENEFIIVNSLNLMGLIAKSLKMYYTAKMFFYAVLNYDYFELNEDEYKGIAFHNLANNYAEAGDTIKAISLFEKALSYDVKRNDPGSLFITQKDLAELYFSMGSYSQAYDLIQACTALYDQLRLYPDYYEVFELARKISAELAYHELAGHYAERYSEESKKFLRQEQEDQFKMGELTASYFEKLNRNKRIMRLQQIIIGLSVLFIISIGYIKIRQAWVKRVIKKELIQLSGGSF